MPQIEQQTIGGSSRGFSFSGIRPERLGAAEYTLVTIAVDRSGSVAGFENELLASAKAALDSCRKSPRAENLLVRIVEFNGSVEEKVGFAPLADLDAAALAAPSCSGGTALRDALYASASATNEYAKRLYDSDFLVNAILFVVTDGDDTSSGLSAKVVRDELSRASAGEWIESVRTVLVGINAARYSAALSALAADCGIDQYVDAGDADPKNLARLAQFVSRSISSQSQALGTGGPSVPLTL